MTLNIGLHTFMRGAMATREDTMSIAQKADGWGFSHIGINDHIVVPTDINSRYPYTDEGTWPGRTFGEALEMLTTMSFIAGCTQDIRILSSVMILPYRPAVLTAKMLATADVLSGGRIIAGCGVGWMPEEFDALGSPAFAERGTVTDEYLDAFRALWSDEHPSMDGEHVRFRNITFMPKPLQKPRLPIWIGGESPVARRRTVRVGDAWYPASNNPQSPLDTVARAAAAEGELRKASEQADRDPATVEMGLVLLSPVDWQAQKAKDGTRRLFTGSTEDMIADAAGLAEAGVDHVSLIFQTSTASETLDRMQRFAEEVLPSIPA